MKGFPEQGTRQRAPLLALSLERFGGAAVFEPSGVRFPQAQPSQKARPSRSRDGG